jgi:hypothetical protein
MDEIDRIIESDISALVGPGDVEVTAALKASCAMVHRWCKTTADLGQRTDAVTRFPEWGDDGLVLDGKPVWTCWAVSGRAHVKRGL